MKVSSEKAASDFVRYLLRKHGWKPEVLKTHLPLGKEFDFQYVFAERKLINRILPRIK